jgi:bifunctional DNA-binding transcriptional regulator/antitoxin component of YhaV-PrlF toxin-antitoxin module
VIGVKQKTSVIENNGTTYLRIPPALKDHLGLKVGDDTVIIEDKEKGKGKYAAFWSVDADVSKKD